MTPRLRTKQEVEVGGSIVTFFRSIDLISTVKRKGAIRGKIRFLNTLFGLTLLLLFQLCPYFGLYFVSRPVQLKLVFSNSTNPTELARSSIINAPILFNVIRSTLNPKGFDNNSKSITRGIRNWSILIGALIRSPYVLLTYQLGNQAILLYPSAYLPYIMCMYIIQNILFSIAVIWVEEYLEQNGIRGYSPIMYYQLMELLVQLKTSPVPGDFNFYKIGFILIIIIVSYLQDYFFTEEIQIRHINANITRTIKYMPSNLIASTGMVHSMIKSAMENFILLVYHPLLDLIEILFLTNTSYLKVPDWILYDMFFKEDYHYYYYINKNSEFGLSILRSLCADLLLYFYVAYKIPFIDPQFSSSHMILDLKSKHNQVVPTVGDNNPLNTKLSRLLDNTLGLGLINYTVLSLLPVYGSVLKGPQLVYYVGRLNQLPQIIKNQEDLPEYLHKIKGKM